MLAFFDTSIHIDLLRGTRPLADVRRLSEHAAEQAAGGVQRAGDRAQAKRLELGAETGAAAIAIELKLESLVGAEIGIVLGEFDFSHGFSLRFDLLGAVCKEAMQHPNDRHARVYLAGIHSCKHLDSR